MKHLLTVSLSVLVASSGIAAPPSRDTAAVNLIVQRQAEAWNVHDIKAYSDLFTVDAQVVNVFGWHWTSRAELQQKLGRAFESAFAKSRMTIETVSIDFLKPDIAVAHVRWSMTGALSPTGLGNDAPERGIQTQVLVKHSGNWKIVDFQNTNAIPERPFPTSR